MFTATLKSKKFIKETSEIVFTITISKDGGESFDKNFKLSSSDSVDYLKRTVQNYLDRLETGESRIASIPDGTTMQYIPTEPDPSVTAKGDWYTNWQKLQEVDKLIAAQILTGAEPAVIALRKLVKDNFKPSYL